MTAFLYQRSLITRAFRGRGLRVGARRSSTLGGPARERERGAERQRAAEQGAGVRAQPERLARRARDGAKRAVRAPIARQRRVDVVERMLNRVPRRQSARGLPVPGGLGEVA